MLNFCDDSGIHPANVRRLQMEVFPCGTFNKADVAAMIEELIENELIEEYEVEGAPYWRATGFTKHQKVDQPTFKHPLPDGNLPQTKRRRRTEPPAPDKEQCSPNNDQDSPNVRRTNGERSEGVHPRKGKEGKGREDNNTPHTPRTRGELNTIQRQRFDQFWEAYPHKKSKGQAEKAFARLNPDDLMLERMLRAIRYQADHRKQLQASGHFVPEHKHPSTWISAKAWEDELAPVQQRPLTGTHLGEVGAIAGPADRRAARAALSASIMDVHDTNW